MSAMEVFPAAAAAEELVDFAAAAAAAEELVDSAAAVVAAELEMEMEMEMDCSTVGKLKALVARIPRNALGLNLRLRLSLEGNACKLRLAIQLWRGRMGMEVVVIEALPAVGCSQSWWGQLLQ